MVDIELSIGYGGARPQAKGGRKFSLLETEVWSAGATERFDPQPTAGAAVTLAPDPSDMSIEISEKRIMQQTKARQILQSLIQGVDPITREELPPETVLQRADVLRALLAGLSALELTAARAQRRAQLPDNVGQTWTTEEERRLVAAFKSGDSPITIARNHGRTLRAIEARLEKLGLITAEQRTTPGGFTGTN